jgi:hypothetical protein
MLSVTDYKSRLAWFTPMGRTRVSRRPTIVVMLPRQMYSLD